MASPIRSVLFATATVSMLAACTSSEGKVSSETECMTATDSSACKRENDKASGKQMTLPQGSGDGNGGSKRGS